MAPSKNEGVAQPEVDPTRDTRVARKGPRVTGRLAKPVYLIHDGKFETTVPAVTRDVVDPDSGEVVQEELIESYTVKGDLPKGSRFGSRKIGVAHQIVEAAEAEALLARGFREATEKEIEASTKNTSTRIDEIAAQERVRAQRNLRATPGGVKE